MFNHRWTEGEQLGRLQCVLRTGILATARSRSRETWRKSVCRETIRGSFVLDLDGIKRPLGMLSWEWGRGRISLKYIADVRPIRRERNPDRVTREDEQWIREGDGEWPECRMGDGLTLRCGQPDHNGEREREREFACVGERECAAWRGCLSSGRTHGGSQTKEFGQQQFRRNTFRISDFEIKYAFDGWL